MAAPSMSQPITIKGAGIFENINKEKVMATTTRLVQSKGIELKRIYPDAHIIPTITA